MNEAIYIKEWVSISALGGNKQDVWKNYINATPQFAKRKHGDIDLAVAQLPSFVKTEVEKLRNVKAYKNLDFSTLMVLYLADAFKGKINEECLVNIGSSRGATGSFEKLHEQFVKEQSVPVYTSPITTNGNISSWVAQKLQTKGANFSHSITCSTALHALANACAWLGANMAPQAICGGSEAPLTAFTLAQAQAMTIYTQEDDAYPVRSLDKAKKRNTMALGEGAGLFLLDKSAEGAVAQIAGLGFGIEKITHGTSVTENGDGLTKSMQEAMQGLKEDEQIDVVITHAPGTVKGDQSEWRALERVFGDNVPHVYNTKWLLGHTYGASGALSLEAALLILKEGELPQIPWLKQTSRSGKPKNILVNAQGFGGNSISVLVRGV